MSPTPPLRPDTYPVGSGVLRDGSQAGRTPSPPEKWEPWPDDTSICIACGGPLPDFPARVVDGENVSGPLCHQHALKLKGGVRS